MRKSAIFSPITWVAALAMLLAAPATGPATAAPPVPAQAKLLGAGVLTPVNIAASCKTQIAIAAKAIDAIVHRRGARTFESVVLALENVGSDLGDNLGAATFIYNVSPDAAVRTASEQCGTDVANFANAETARPDIYAALAAARDSRTARTQADRKLQEFALIAAKRAGAALPAQQRKTFVALEAQLTEAAQKFQANLSDDASTISLTPAQLTGLPPDFTGSLKTDATGNTIVPVNESTVSTFMTSEPDAGARKAYYIAYARRGGDANVALLQSAIVARDHVATLLGYPNWAAYIAADRMAGTPQRIATFLDEIDAALLPKARAERAQLAAAKNAPLDPWDVTYYQAQQRKALYSVDRNVVKTYFPAPHVIDAVLHIYSHLLGITFTPAPELPKWDPAVLAYDVTDSKTGVNRGAFYLDLYPRPGKFEHFDNSGITARRVLPDGTVKPELNTILGNWPAPVPGKPALLSHDDVITFFHEFGHNVAALLGDTPYETLNLNFRWDFVEAPSQMLENFVWDPTILKEISSNVDTGAPLPDDLIAKMDAARYFDEASFEVSQAFLSTVDQLYHTLPPPIDTTAVWKRTLMAMTPSVFVDGTIPQASFGHLMSGYEAQYYGYLWSKVYAQDMFTAFQKGGLENPAVGARYRKDILAPARMIEPDAEVRAFLGRPMDPSTFYRQLGITKAP
jgi:thimet oligopeptidase